ncbi:MAG: UDP-N-acetylmuramoyl-L-alanyl-D-glutamate--2,6-diaminopimelate ligase [Holophagaceae bacterium]
MKFGDWIQGLEVVAGRGPMDAEVLDLTSDSREVRPGACFVALKGEKHDGAAFIPGVVARGATAVLCDGEAEVPPGIAFGVLADGRRTMADAARKLYGAPDERLALIGVTGTNGKTTVTTLIRQLLRGRGLGCGLIGTVTNAAGEVEEEASRTTPESPAFYRWLRRSADAGDVAVAAEVSSHALCLGRVHGARFRVGVFTNLTQDHLDFHGDMEAYFEAKRRLFTQSRGALVNADCPYGRRILAEDPRARSFALDGEATYRAVDVDLGPTGTRFTLLDPGGRRAVDSPLLGRFNVSNLLAALGALAEAGFDLADLLLAVPGLTGAPGRLERVDRGQPFGVVVDYAHTPDALEKILAEGRRLLKPGGRLHALFGCGGDRDRTKRPLMAAAVAKRADVVWHTSDNPRGEDPERVLDDAAPGIPEGLRADPARYHRLADRREAVRLAILDARPGDLLILAGKGHEPYQEIAGVKHPYSDRAAVEAALEALR